MNSEDCEDKEKVKTFFNHLDKKLAQAKDLMVKEAKKGDKNLTQMA